jgi:hypothetical protein
MFEHEVLLHFNRTPLEMQKPTGSVIHKLKEALINGAVHQMILGGFTEMSGAFGSDNEHIFVIEHDWAAAFATAKDFNGGEIRLPFDTSIFEFQFNSIRFVAAVSDESATKFGVEHGITKLVFLFAQTKEGWCSPGMFSLDSDGKLPLVAPADDVDGVPMSIRILTDVLAAIGKQIRALLISLDAEVAVAEVVRAPHKLNAQREKKGQPPLLDYHIVSLARRSRAERLPTEPGHEPHHRVRMHFRRGHWRHFENHKTWIRWMLVGDPDLGFIDKHYRL